MEDYKIRMINEYTELKDRYDKLHRILVKHEAKTLEFEPTCPIEILAKQASFMSGYLHCLEIRAEIEHINLKEKTAVHDA